MHECMNEIVSLENTYTLCVSRRFSEKTINDKLAFLRAFPVALEVAHYGAISSR